MKFCVIILNLIFRYNDKYRKMLLEMAKERGVAKSRLGTPTSFIGKDLYVGNKLEKIESIIKKNIENE